VTGWDGRGGRNSGECNAWGGPHVRLGPLRGPMDVAQTVWWPGRHGLMLGGAGVHGGSAARVGRLGMACIRTGSNLK
jgi:hypothetical protein